MKFARVCIIGHPNSGKSTLTNCLIGEKVSIVTRKMHTTRDNIIGLISEGDTQIAFVDTPGVLKNPRFKLEKTIVKRAFKELTGADFVCIVLDGTKDIEHNILLDIEYYHKIPHKPVVVLNKIDLLSDKSKLIEIASKLKDKGFSHIFMISAKKGAGVEDLKNHYIDNASEGGWQHDPELITDRSLKRLAEDISREKLFKFFNKEIPYSLAVETEAWKEDDKKVVIHQVVFVLKESQKKVILSKSGDMLKMVSQQARNDIEKMVGKKTHLYLFVKVKEKWMDHIAFES